MFLKILKPKFTFSLSIKQALEIHKNYMHLTQKHFFYKDYFRSLYNTVYVLIVIIKRDVFRSSAS